MAYDENIRIIAEELERLKNRPTGDTLPAVETTDEGKVLTVNSSGKWAAADPSSSYDLDYSTTEKNTGMKWIDGKPIYQKTITFTNITISKTGVKIGEIETIDNIIEAQGHVIENGGMVYGIPDLDLRWYVNNTDVLLLCYYASSWNIDSGYLTIKYTKTTTTKKKGAK